MDKKLLKDLVILIGVIIIAAVGARVLAGGETLSDYAVKHPEKAGVASSQEETSEAKEDSTVAASNQTISQTDVTSNKLSENATYSVSASSASVVSSKPEPNVKSSTGTSSAESASVSTSSNVSKSASVVSSVDTSSDAATNTASVIQDELSPERTTYQEGFYYEPISNDVFSRISGISYPVNCTVPLSELSYVVVQYVDFEGSSQSGELICNKDLAQDMVEIFYELFSSGYQIESIKLVDEFDGDDTASMLANNTSCFNYRIVEGTTKLSNHSYGRAIDINPFYNPYVTYKKDGSVKISPEGSEAYADRDASFPYKIDENDLAYKLFKAHGFKWGGDWNNSKDYQHFEKK